MYPAVKASLGCSIPTPLGEGWWRNRPCARLTGDQAHRARRAAPGSELGGGLDLVRDWRRTRPGRTDLLRIVSNRRR